MILISRLSEEAFERKLQEIEYRNKQIELKKELWKARTKHWPKFKTPSMSKIALWVGFFMLGEIIIFCQYITLMTFSVEGIVAMIGAIGGWISMFYSYTKKSTVENSSGGIIYETAMKDYVNSETEDAVG